MKKYLLLLLLVFLSNLLVADVLEELISNRIVDSITVNGTDTISSDTIYIGGYGFISVETWGSQANDSVAIDSMVIMGSLIDRSGTNVSYTRAYDANGSLAWAKITTWTLAGYTAGTHEIRSIANPPLDYIYVRIYTSSADNGTNANIKFKWKLTP